MFGEIERQNIRAAFVSALEEGTKPPEERTTPRHIRLCAIYHREQRNALRQLSNRNGSVTLRQALRELDRLDCETLKSRRKDIGDFPMP